MELHQTNSDNAYVQNIENQHIYLGIEGTAFVPLSDCKEEKHYQAIKDSLYYPRKYLDKALSVLEEKHSILIQGEQGSGKSILSFKLAE